MFASITGALGDVTFMGTFSYCDDLTEIPVGLFDSLDLDSIDPEIHMDLFSGMFAGDIGLTGPSAQTANGDYLYELSGFGEDVAWGMYGGDKWLDDYDTMPDYLKEQ